jgi:periplasmic protein TonB
VIAAGPSRTGGQRGAHVQGWLVSVLVHGTVALAAILLVKQIPLAPQDEAFTWNVAMVLPGQPVHPAASPQNQEPDPLVPSTTSIPSSPIQQTAPEQTLPPPQPLAQQATSSIAEEIITPVLPDVRPPQPTTHSQSEIHTTPSAKPTAHRPVTAMVAESTSIVNQDDAQVASVAESAAQTVPSNRPSEIPEQATQANMVPAPMQMAAISPSPTGAPAKRDFGWLSEAILRRVEELKRYPASARVDRAEGKVVVKAVINEDGNVGEIVVFQSSGHPGLDKAAIDTLRQAAPFHLPRPLGQPGMTIKIPMSYQLDR